MQPFLKLGLISSLVSIALGASGSGPTWELYQESQHRPILLYECYRTGVTVEPEGTVNFTVLLDATQQTNGKATGTTWMTTKNTPDSYKKVPIDFSYDDASSSIVLEDQDITEQVMELLLPFNNVAYYLKLSVSGDASMAVYKIYDEESGCGNAAALLKVVDPKQTKGFTFVQEVAEPTQVCVKTKLCAE